MMWPYKTIDNLTITIVFVSIFITLIAPMHWFTQTPEVGNFIFLFLIVLNGIGGLILFYGIANGKNFNKAIWNSKYYNG